MEILIIEDDKGIVDLLQAKLNSPEDHAVCVYSANDALSWLNKHSPDLMLLDYGLPDMNGDEFINELRKRKQDVPPFLVATGQGNEEVAVKMMKLGAKDYVIKDLNLMEILPERIKLERGAA